MDKKLEKCLEEAGIHYAYAEMYQKGYDRDVQIGSAHGLVKAAKIFCEDDPETLSACDDAAELFSKKFYEELCK